MKTLFEDLDLSQKVAVVNGSSMGIGQATAQVLAAQGATVLLLARNEGKLKETLNALDTSKGQSHNYLSIDHSQSDELIQELGQYLSDKKLQVDILINNSGGPAPGELLAAVPEVLESAFQNHLICNQKLAGLVVPQMTARGYGRIINVLSTSVKVPLKNLGVSNIIRAAVASWSKTLSNELAFRGITVNSVLPGFTNTKRLTTLTRQWSEEQGVSLEAYLEKLKESVPMKRFASAEEIAKVIGFLASPAASYINGVSLRVDGGRTGSI